MNKESNNFNQIKITESNEVELEIDVVLVVERCSSITVCRKVTCSINERVVYCEIIMLLLQSHGIQGTTVSSRNSKKIFPSNFTFFDKLSKESEYLTYAALQ